MAKGKNLNPADAYRTFPLIPLPRSPLARKGTEEEGDQEGAHLSSFRTPALT